MSEKHFAVHASQHKSSKYQHNSAKNLSKTVRTLHILDLKVQNSQSLSNQTQNYLKTHFSSPSHTLNSISLPLIARELKCFIYKDL